MSAESGTNRWWENYLVRYLMPSIAGVAILGWLFASNPNLRSILFIPKPGVVSDTAVLTLVFLYGNLFCYVASYPVLGFHVTRVVDFSGDTWNTHTLRDGYAWTLVLIAVCMAVFHLGSPELHFWLAFGLSAAFSILQLARLSGALSPRLNVRGVHGAVSPAFGFAFSLAKRRGLLSVTTKTPQVEKDTAWHQDFIAGYRHLREHGNSAFIFILEIALALLVYFVTRKPGQTSEQELGAIGTLFALWATPAMFVHLLGQHLERRFSLYDRRVGEATAEIAEPEEL